MIETTYDAVILGAGPAGSTTAAELAQNGWKVLLADKAGFPREKVCGGFVGPENRAWLTKQGIWNRFLAKGASPVRKVWMTAPRGVSLRMHFSSQGKDACGLAVERREFDQVLVDLARQNGATVKTSVKLQNREGDRAELLDLRSGVIEVIRAAVWIDACGAVNRPDAGKPQAFGVMAHFEDVRFMKGQVVLHFAQGGHFGLNPVAKNQTAVCYVADKPLMDKAGGDLEKLFDLFKKANPFLARQMKGAVRVSPWRGIPVPPVREPRFFDGQWFFVGDAVTAVNPVVGGGMTMAIQSGLLLAKAFGEKKSVPLLQNTIARTYECAWKKLYQSKVRFSHHWGWLSHRALAADAVLGFFAANKKIFRFVFEMHHPLSRGITGDLA